MRRRRTTAGLLALTVLTGCAGTSGVPAPTSPVTGSADPAGPVRIAAGPTGQTAVLAHVYAGRLREAGFDATVVGTGTERADYLAALERGDADLVADYSGNLYLHLRGRAPVGSATPAPTGSAAPRPTPTPEDGGLAEDLSELLGLGEERADDDDVLSGVRDVLPEGLRALEPAPAENTVAVVVTRATAVEHELDDLEDLGPVCEELALGTDLDFAGRSYGPEGLEDAYECVPARFVPFGDQEELVDALLGDRVQAAALFTASPAIEDNALVVLADPLNNFVPQRVVPVGTEELPDAAVDVVDAVSAQIDTDDLVLMTRMTTARDPYTPEEAARYWLEGGDDT
ncbi:glycine betaine ABC transporter substrate-binding protein [Kocuria turfanensis]|uniref:Glycine/betaine ABC transporter permease n=1 Tax=Kocuria turfanensis TaxID=388357 RepID=A0A512I874_9MICC|nr:glycine betaine ABC transporter substrate-binding protein [Kocuria turfanensis]GEO93900.1 glycine/betaine ABC transporter permease [Kocuria turfanensis]